MKKKTWSSGSPERHCPRTRYSPSPQQPQPAGIQRHPLMTTETTKPAGHTRTQARTPPQPTPKQATLTLTHHQMNNDTPPRPPPPRRCKATGSFRPTPRQALGDVDLHDDVDFHDNNKHSNRTKNPTTFRHLQLGRIPERNPKPEYGAPRSKGCRTNVTG